MVKIKMLQKLFIIIVTMFYTMQASSTETIAEKLGFAKDAKLLIIHADDGGLMQSINLPTQRLMELGSISSASYMMPTPWVYQAILFFSKCEQCDFGLHITLNSEWSDYRWGAVACADRVASLLNDSGTLWKTREQYLQHTKISEAVIEIEAQINKALKLGFKPSHIDTHMGTIFIKPEVLKEYVLLADKYHMLAMLPKWSEPLHAYLEARPYYDAAALKAVLQVFEKENRIMLDHLITDVGGDTLQARKANYTKMLETLKPGLTQVIVHLSDRSDEFDSIIKQRPVEVRRYWDVEILSSAEFRSELKASNVKLISWKDLQRLSQ